MVRKSLTGVNKANAAALIAEEEQLKMRRAYDMRRKGEAWWTIGEELGISPNGAKLLVEDAIAQASQMVGEHVKRQLLVLEVERLDELQKGIWDEAVGGNKAAIDSALRIIAARAKLLGLDDMSTVTVTQQTVVIGGTSEEYIRALQLVAAPRTIQGEVTRDEPA